MTMLTRIALLCLPALCYSTCDNTEAPDGEWRDGCIVKSCESGALKESLADECVHLIEKTVEDILVEKLAEKGIECSKNEKSSVEEDRDYLFLGPSGLTLGKSEVLHLPSFTKANCTPPSFPPKGYTYYSYVGTLTPEGPLLCGGDHNGETQSFCHLLTRSGNWEEVQGMNMRRSGAAALEIDGGWWVTGGFRGGMKTDTELWDGKTWQPHHELPAPMGFHCMVRINATTVFFIAGDNTREDGVAYFYSPATGFVQTEGPQPRTLFACGRHNDYVIIAGGNGAVAHPYVSTEFFSLDTLTWHTGPSVDYESKYIWNGKRYREQTMYNYAGDIFNWKGRTFWIGELAIWELLGEFGSWQWTKVKVLENMRSKFETFLMTAQECSGWQ